jgi:hypothetical protein
VAGESDWVLVVMKVQSLPDMQAWRRDGRGRLRTALVLRQVCLSREGGGGRRRGGTGLSLSLNASVGERRSVGEAALAVAWAQLG